MGSSNTKNENTKNENTTRVVDYGREGRWEEWKLSATNTFTEVSPGMFVNLSQVKTIQEVSKDENRCHYMITMMNGETFSKSVDMGNGFGTTSFVRRNVPITNQEKRSGL